VRFSAIIPARNEEDTLPRLLDTLDEARMRYSGIVEVIVSDNASTDSTAEIARSRGCIVAGTAVRRIAAVRNAGAAAASGEILIFVDADARVHPGTFDEISSAMASGRFVGGATGVKVNCRSFGFALTYGLLMPWVWALRMDTGPTFAFRRDFEAIGGYDETVFYAEDVDFLVRLKRHGRKDGRTLARLGSVRALFDTRKFDRYGDWHYFIMAPRLLWWLLFNRRGTDDWFEKYWYGE
jgi:glycosyltransferase involved in cell wall biosynthesis